MWTSRLKSRKKNINGCSSVSFLMALVVVSLWQWSLLGYRRLSQPHSTKAGSFAIRTAGWPLSSTNNTTSVPGRDLAEHVITENKEACASTPFAFNMTLCFTGSTRNWPRLLRDQPSLFHALSEIGWALVGIHHWSSNTKNPRIHGSRRRNRTRRLQ